MTEHPHPLPVPHSSDPQADALKSDPAGYFAPVAAHVGERAYASFAAREPVMVAGFATWALSNIGAIVLGHTRLVTAEQWGAVATYVTPLVTAALLAGIAAVVRRYVTPAWKRYTGDTLPPLPEQHPSPHH